MILNQIASGGGGTTPAEFSPLRLVESSAAATLTADATAHTKGAWTEMIAATGADATWAVVSLHNFGASSTDTSVLIDFALGAAESEVPFVENVAVGGAMYQVAQLYTFPLPYSIPAGSRLSARIQSNIGAEAGTASVSLFSGGNHTPATTALTVMGTSTATSAGAEVGTAWTEVEDSTPATFRYFVVVPSLSTTASSNSADPLYFGTGAAAAEVEVGKVSVFTGATEYVASTVYGPTFDSHCLFAGAAAGTRLVAKRAAPACDVCVIGIP